MADPEVPAALVGLFEAKVMDPAGRIHVEDLLSAAAAATGEACIAAAGDFDPEHHAFTPGSVVMSDRVNEILANDVADWSGTETSVFGIVRTGALASGYVAADLPPLDAVFRGFAAGIADGSTPWGYVPLSVSQDHRPFVGPLRQAYELRSAIRALLTGHGVPVPEWPTVCAFALVLELGRVREAIDPGVALRIVLETVNGMAKTAPMTDEVFNQSQSGAQPPPA